MLQVDQEVHEVQSPWTGGQTLLHDFFCMAGPSQPGPPLTGLGESQVLCLTWTPRPHSWLQSDHSAHWPQLPGTETNYFWLISQINFETLNIFVSSKKVTTDANR